MTTIPKQDRVLAIDPAGRGFGFVVLEGTEQLIDWGVKASKYESGAVSFVIDLIARYEPDVLVLEDIRSETRRSARERRFLKEVRLHAGRRHLSVQSFTRKRVQGAFRDANATTKHQIATAVTDRFPILRLQLPPARKLWMPEDYRMAIFDAASLAFTYFDAEHKRTAV
jgi:Holliday junction resolvasome RuvABC endonuclease subunit